MRTFTLLSLALVACSSRADGPSPANRAASSSSAVGAPSSSAARPLAPASSGPGAPGPAVVAHLFAGPASAHACFTSERGGLFCWGRSDAGQLGPDVEGPSRPSPSRVAMPGPVSAAALGEKETCALLQDGSVRCVGEDPSGKRRAEDALEGLDAVEEIALGADFGCARSHDRAVRCWGRVPGRDEIALKPSLVEGLSATQIATSSHTLCALDADGAVRCVGDNPGGKVSIGAPARLASPTVVAYASGQKRIAVTDLGVCGVDDSEGRCWGDREGSSSLDLWRVRDLSVGADGLVCGLRDADFECERLPFGRYLPWRADVPLREIAVGRGFLCALTDKLAVSCWGDNDFAQLGLPAPKPRPVPQELAALAGATRIAAGTASVCALTPEKKIRCLGDNGKAQSSWSPNGTMDTPLGDDAASSITRADDLSVGGGIRCAFTDGLPTCWGDNRSNQIASVNPGLIEVPQTFASLGKLRRLVFGPTHACSLSDDGKVRCWGGEGKERQVPTDVAGLGPVHDLAVGGDRACALLDDGTVSCFALRGAHAREPHKIEGAKGWASIAAGGRHYCGVTAKHEVACFGANDAGQLARPLDAKDGERAATVSKLDHVKQITLGETFTCALLDDGTVRCFGSASEGELGRDEKGSSAEPVAVPGLEHAVEIAASAHAVSARLRDGKVLAWGGRAFFAKVGDAVEHSDKPHTLDTSSAHEEGP